MIHQQQQADASSQSSEQSLKWEVLLHFSNNTITISKERYYRLLEIEVQYQAQQQETRRLHQLLEEVIHRFEDDPKVIHLKDYLAQRSA